MREKNQRRKGASTKTEPIRSERDIRNIKKLLSDKPRDLAIFTLGINTNLRASDIVRLRVGQLRHLEPGETLTLVEKKTSKRRVITINRAVHAAIKNLLATMPDADNSEPLFQSRKGKGQLTVSHLCYLVKGWCKEVNLRGNFGSHTLRRTFGWVHRVIHGTDLPTLCHMFNHSTQRQTLDYLGIQETEITDAYMKEV